MIDLAKIRADFPILTETVRGTLAPVLHTMAQAVQIVAAAA